MCTSLFACTCGIMVVHSNARTRSCTLAEALQQMNVALFARSWRDCVGLWSAALATKTCWYALLRRQSPVRQRGDFPAGSATRTITTKSNATYQYHGCLKHSQFCYHYNPLQLPLCLWLHQAQLLMLLHVPALVQQLPLPDQTLHTSTMVAISTFDFVTTTTYYICHDVCDCTWSNCYCCYKVQR